MTEAFRGVTAAFLCRTPLDVELRGHLDFVFNQVLQIVRRGVVTKESTEYIGKMLFRLWGVYQAYAAQKVVVDSSGLMAAVVGIGKQIAAQAGV